MSPKLHNLPHVDVLSSAHNTDAVLIVPTRHNEANPTRQALVREWKQADRSVQMWWKKWKATDKTDTEERNRCKALAKQWEDRRKQRSQMLATYDYYEWEQEKARRVTAD